jgi:hypothetical protein
MRKIKKRILKRWNIKEKSLNKEFEEDNLRNLKKHKDFRIAAEYVADLIKEVPGGNS